jgi:F0F1-type ATP synthase assembly protein I
VHVIPAYHQLLQRYRAYDAEAGAPQRIARYLTMSATTVLVGGVLGYLVERGFGIPYATVAGIGLGIIAFFRMILQTLGTARHMTRVESAHAAELQRLQDELYAAFEAVDRQGPPKAQEDANL